MSLLREQRLEADGWWRRQFGDIWFLSNRPKWVCEALLRKFAIRIGHLSLEEAVEFSGGSPIIRPYLQQSFRLNPAAATFVPQKNNTNNTTVTPTRSPSVILDSSTPSPSSGAAATPALSLSSPNTTPSSSPPEPEGQQPQKQQDQTEVQDYDNAFDWQLEQIDSAKRALEEAERVP
ncbi:hypothetical protein F4808DRAFT_462451 [Astrocystis sublimbata]|nr:hypothetical protein F4808DRAFT_462451 [Astrocystis sublimbata]